MIKKRIHLINKKVLETPEFIPSLTSIKCSSSYLKLLIYLINQKISHFMISAYDLYYIQSKITNPQIEQIQKNKSLFFLDSGAFEAFHGFFSKNWNKDLLINTAKILNPDILVSLDNININSNNSFLEDLKNYDNMRYKLQENNQFYEIIIQERKIEKIKLFLENLEIDKKLLAICVPERNLGNAYKTRYKTLKTIIELIKRDFGYEEVLFHLMGCSNPLLIINYSKLGVDLFDGIHWNDSLYLPNNNKFTDLCQLFEIDCSCDYCKELIKIKKNNQEDFEKFYIYYALSHNLEQFKNLMKNIRNGMI